MMKKLILISGSPCVGKTAVGTRLFESYDNSAYLDGDWCWCVHPFSVSDRRLRNGDKSMSFILSNYLDSDFEYVFFTSVVLTDVRIREGILNGITAKEYGVIGFTLTCSEEMLKKRHDRRGDKGETNCYWLHLPAHPGDIVIDTDSKSIREIVEEMKKHIDSAAEQQREACSISDETGSADMEQSEHAEEAAFPAATPVKKTIPIKTIVDAIEETMDGWQQFYNTVTGEVESVPDYDNDYADMSEFEETAEIIENSDNYVRLPSQYELHEYSIMESFAEEKGNAVLMRALRGHRPYRTFKDRAIDLGLDQEYYAYRTKAYGEIAREWCRGNEIPFAEE